MFHGPTSRVGTIGKILKKAGRPGGRAAGWLFFTKIAGFFQNLPAFFKNLKKATGRPTSWPAGRTTLPTSGVQLSYGITQGAHYTCDPK
jgi:hypothetical protein